MSDPVEMRRLLRLELRRLRNVAGFTQRQVAEAMDWSSSKVIRIESGENAITVSDLRSLAHYYGVKDDDEIERLENLARDSKRQPYEQYSRILPSNAVRFFRYEYSAGTVRHFEPLVIPGLLQIESYTRALVSTRQTDRDRIDQLVSSRQDRQEVIDRVDPPPPRYIFLLDESIFWRPIGGPRVMTEQLRHIVAVNDRPNVEIRVIPQATGAYAGLLGSYVHLEFSGAMAGLSDILFVESQAGDLLYNEDSAIIERCLEQFNDMEKLALSKNALASFIEDLIGSGWGWTSDPSLKG